MDVALATENNAVDGQIVVELVRLMKQITLLPWATDRVRLTGGWRGIVDATTTFLNFAAEAGVRHAIVMVDNDGGQRKRPAHASTHEGAVEAKNKEEGCATCLVRAQIPAAWMSTPLRSCVVVPVQTLETWLLAVNGFAFKNETPEMNFHRRVLKRDFYGSVWGNGDAARLAHARAALAQPGALAILRQRPSFVEFEQQLSAWP